MAGLPMASLQGPLPSLDGGDHLVGRQVPEVGPRGDSTTRCCVRAHLRVGETPPEGRFDLKRCYR